MAIYEFLSKIMTKVDKNIPVTALYLDMSKAFDLVDHNTLLYKLNRYGIRGNALKLIESYLTNRKQVTQIISFCTKTKQERYYTSDKRGIQYGVIQGSVLSSLLFLIYINDFPEAIDNPMVLFADDSTVIFDKYHNNTIEYISDITNTIKKLDDWLKCNNLKPNINKTKIMQFKNSNKNNLELEIEYMSKTIENTNVTKFLGLHIDENLKWNIHIDKLSKRLNQYSFALYRLAKVASQETVITAYHGYVGSILRYGIIFWGNATDKDIIFKAQKKCIRAICNLRRTESCKPFFTRLKILTLPCLYISETALFVKRNDELFTYYKSDRNGKKINGRNSRTTLYSKSAFGMTHKIFNTLPKA